MNAKIQKGKKEKPKKEAKKEKENEKATRSKRFTQSETDLLCDLVLASDINTMVTNKITPYGRLRGWDDICRSFNASANVTVSCTSVFVSDLCIEFNSGFLSIASNERATNCGNAVITSSVI